MKTGRKLINILNVHTYTLNLQIQFVSLFGPHDYLNREVDVIQRSLDVVGRNFSVILRSC